MVMLLSLIRFEKKDRKLRGKPENLNLLNFALRILGPQREQDICNQLLIFQIICSAVAFVIRYKVFTILF